MGDKRGKSVDLLMQKTSLPSSEAEKIEKY